jgi:hypothetical protein
MGQTQVGGIWGGCHGELRIERNRGENFSGYQL